MFRANPRSSNFHSVATTGSHKARKDLGQNFLQDQRVIHKIIDLVEITSTDTVLEIGPGLGALTRHLDTSSAKRICAVEICDGCIGKLSDLKRTEIIRANALDIDEASFADAAQRVKLVSNLPYNISTLLLMKWLDRPYLFERMVLMFQKEVAHRIVSSGGGKAFGAVSVLAQYVCDVSLELDVPSVAFEPEPKVDSAVVLLKPRDNVDLELYSKLKRVCKEMFLHRRKMVKLALVRLFGGWADICAKAQINPASRCEDLSVETFVDIARELE